MFFFLLCCFGPTGNPPPPPPSLIYQKADVRTVPLTDKGLHWITKYNKNGPANIYQSFGGLFWKCPNTNSDASHLATSILKLEWLSDAELTMRHNPICVRDSSLLTYLSQYVSMSSQNNYELDKGCLNMQSCMWKDHHNTQSCMRKCLAFNYSIYSKKIQLYIIKCIKSYVF